MSETSTKLTPRQYELRRFLWNNRTVWVSSSAIAKSIPEYGKPSVAYKKINQDVKEINASGRFDKIIITDRTSGYKLATKKEFAKYSKRAYAEAVRKIVYVNGIIKDAKMDGQGIIPGLEGYQREFYDKFVEEEKAEQKAKRKEKREQCKATSEESKNASVGSDPTSN